MPNQPRQTFDEAKLVELTNSIQIEGVLQPIVVRYETSRDIYVIVHGERRWRASRAAGLATIPAIVRDVPENRRLIQQLMENIVRDDLNAVDRAAALRVLKIQLGDAPWEQVAEAVGIRRSRLFQLLGTEKLPEHIQADIRSGRISEKQSRALQGLPGGHQQALRDVIIADDLPADEAMRLARELKVNNIADDAGAAADALARFRAPRRFVNTREDELGELLAAVADAASGGSAERATLKRLADERQLAPFDEDRLVSETLALARSLARTPRTELRPGFVCLRRAGRALWRPGCRPLERIAGARCTSSAAPGLVPRHKVGNQPVYSMAQRRTPEPCTLHALFFQCCFEHEETTPACRPKSHLRPTTGYC